MKLVIWLGNPWTQYQNNRHNAGFLFLEWLVQNIEWIEDFHYENKFKWEIANAIIWGEKIIFLKPKTFMNLSWESVILLMNFYKIDISDILVIYDDVSMDFWKIRFREKWSSGWQNGIKSIIWKIWDQFKRIKIWIWNDERFDLSDWVLSDFSKIEKEKLIFEVFPLVKELLLKQLY